ncbi:MAG: hypothetical protein IT567_01380 [Alphaproteobacteria bacterium]|nr:hypothetical protein [Alphaproteobacteria bacterium]
MDDPAILEDGAFVHFHPDGNELGLYGMVSHDTQFISKWGWELDGVLLEAAREDHTTYRFRYTVGTKGQISVLRRVQLLDGRNYRETVDIANHGADAGTVVLAWRIHTGFKGIFELREAAAGGGYHRDVALQTAEHRGIFSYHRQDSGIEVKTVIDAPDAEMSPDGDVLLCRHRIALAAGDACSVSIAAAFSYGVLPSSCILPSREEWREEFGLSGDRPQREAEAPFVRAAEDLRGMMLRTRYGIALAAGMPRFMNPFGRDQLLSALMLMPESPEQRWRTAVVEGILHFLAAHQGTEIRSYTPVSTSGEALPNVQPFIIETPGEIPHEVRYDEQSGMGLKDTWHPLGKRPFGRYYGTADTTPLFVATLGKYIAASQNMALLRELETPLRHALEWMSSREFAGLDAHGFITYEALPAYTPGGPLAHKSWKDAANAMVDAAGLPVTQAPDGTLRTARIATIEVQAYAYRAYREAANMLSLLDDEKMAAQCTLKADHLQKNVLSFFRTQDTAGKEIYAMAIAYPEGGAEPIVLNVHNSNAAQVIWTGIYGEGDTGRDNIRCIVDSVLSSAHLWSGWGIRSLGANEKGYDTLSSTAYHRGPVWPHETALTAMGFHRYGYHAEAEKLQNALRDLAEVLGGSLPELLSGQPRNGHAPQLLGTASRIQTWSASALLAVHGLASKET